MVFQRTTGSRSAFSASLFVGKAAGSPTRVWQWLRPPSIFPSSVASDPSGTNCSIRDSSSLRATRCNSACSRSVKSLSRLDWGATCSCVSAWYIGSAFCCCSAAFLASQKMCAQHCCSFLLKAGYVVNLSHTTVPAKSSLRTYAETSWSRLYRTAYSVYVSVFIRITTPAY